MTFSETTSLAKARISPVLGSMATRNSRAGPTAFLAADNKASCTADVRTSRLMPFSFSQYSKTAKKSAFISVCQTARPHEGNKKVGKFYFPTLARWGNPANLYRSMENNKFSVQTRQAAFPRM